MNAEKSEKKKPTKTGVDDHLRRAIEESGLSARGVALLADIDPGIVKRYLERRRGLTWATVARIADALGLRFVESARAAARR